MKIELTKEQERLLVDRIKEHFSNNFVKVGTHFDHRTFETLKVKISWYSGCGYSFYITSKELGVEFNLHYEKSKLDYVDDLVDLCHNLYYKGSSIITDEIASNLFDRIF